MRRPVNRETGRNLLSFSDAGAHEHFIITCDYNFARGRRRVASFNAKAYAWRRPVGGFIGVDDECSQSARSIHILVVDFAFGSLNRLLYLGEGSTAQG
jgi:hypothetical protein